MDTKLNSNSIKSNSKDLAIKDKIALFNQKNNIKQFFTSEDFKTVPSKLGAERQIQIVGKKTSTFKEVFKRFSRNYFAIFSLFLLLGLFIIGSIVILTSPNDPIEYLGKVSDIQPSFSSNLPPFWRPVITRTLDAYVHQNIIHALKVMSEKNPEFLVKRIHIPNTTSFIFEYNAYQFLELLTGKKYFTVLGTNSASQDIWTRNWFGFVQSITLGVLITSVETLIGVPLGAYLGFNIGKKTDTLFLRVVEVFSSIPYLVLFIMLSSLFGTNFFAIFIISISTGWISPMFITRNLIVQVKNSEFVTAAQTTGVSKVRLVLFHALPAIVGKVFYFSAIRIPSVIYSISALSFLGIIHDDNTYNFGTIMNKARSDYYLNIWNLLFPVLLLVLSTLSLKFAALGVNDALEPKAMVKK